MTRELYDSLFEQTRKVGADLDSSANESQEKKPDPLPEKKKCRKKKVKEAFKTDEIEGEEDEVYTKMEEALNPDDIEDFKGAAENITIDLMDAGFEEDQIVDFFMNRLNLNSIAIDQHMSKEEPGEEDEEPDQPVVNRPDESKKVAEGWGDPEREKESPYADPGVETPEKTKKQRPRTPLAPDPGQTPEPKGENPDVVLFKKMRKNRE